MCGRGTTFQTEEMFTSIQRQKESLACVYGGFEHHSEWPDSVTDGLYVVVEGEDM